jgi:o-succinylbenzoate synthase
MKAGWKKYDLHFKRPSGTSRGILKTKTSYFIFLEANNLVGIGECGLLKGLSIDDVPEYEETLNEVCERISIFSDEIDLLNEFPSIQFGLEMALLDLKNGAVKKFFDNSFYESAKGIDINGLVWMGTKEFMLEQIKQKIEQSYSCIKLKIGAIDFDSEIELLKTIRKEYSEKEIELRVDANGAFSTEEAYKKLCILSKLKLHSIEQPIKQGQYEKMAQLCETTPLPIALDEELIGINSLEKKEWLLKNLKPQYIILKPSLIGGFKKSKEWIDIAQKNNIGWWITSALESNVGLNAIAQLTSSLNTEIPQGLGTGQLYTNNFNSPLEIENAKLYYRKNKTWDLSLLMND